jgi:hypothetical protein
MTRKICGFCSQLADVPHVSGFQTGMRKHAVRSVRK